MYVIIKRDKAEHLKEKLHHIKTAAIEVLDCIEEAASKHHEIADDYREETRRRDMDYYSEEHRYPAEREVYRHHELTRRGRGRY